MLYLKPTKRGLGVTLWGTYDDLNFLYDMLYELSPDSDSNIVARKYHDQTNLFLLDFSHHIRKAYQGDRIKRKTSHFSSIEIDHYGVHVSWVRVLFWLSSLRHNLRFITSDKFIIGIIFNLEYWLEQSLKQYEPIYGTYLFPYYRWFYLYS
jgi:hypothetical protein